MKRLIVCCDGTWLDAQSGLMMGKIPPPSNVTRISQAIRAITHDGIEQVVFYQAGVASQGNFLSRVIGGITAEGIAENIRSGYAFLANNYAPGDEIFFFGFSRGAFTVRSIAGMMNAVGLLTKSGLQYLGQIFEDWENARNPNYRSSNPNLPFPRKPSVSNPEYRLRLERHGLTRTAVPIKVIGVWETVGALGVPQIPWLEALPIWGNPPKTFLFHDTKLSNHICNAFQALALDEHRSAFVPAIWEKGKGNTTNLRQVWFPGAHSNVGGGYPDQALANISLAWMMSQAKPFLDFYSDYILDCVEETLAYYRRKNLRPEPWSFGKIYRSFSGIYVLGGRTTRKPQSYRASNSHSSDTGRPLRQTMEYIHPSVRARKINHGPGIDGIGEYEATALSQYKLRGPTAEQPLFFWQPRHRVKEEGRSEKQSRNLYESPLWAYEIELLKHDESMTDFIMDSRRVST